ncbi:DUF6325 family protein [Herbiconiux sp. UC225_62]|uniref:DUF6325 family protein n=1 Tax=Herbiconiux sp. UC225_62 TaxID=3350168 RepID=UPI0036D27637
MSDEYGPIEFVVILIPDDSAVAAVLSVVGSQLDSSGVRLLDVVVIDRAVTGELTFAELSDDDLGALVLAAEGITSDEDALHLAAALPAGESALLLAIESVWLKNLTLAAGAAGGEVIHADRIPADVVNAAAATIN